MEKTLYRYTRDTYEMFDDEGHFDEEGTPQVDLVKYPVIRETKCFYFIQVRRTIGLWSEKKVSKNAKNTFAYDTKEKALENYKHRCARNLMFCKMNLKLAEVFNEQAKEMTTLSKV